MESSDRYRISIPQSKNHQRARPGFLRELDTFFSFTRRSVPPTRAGPLVPGKPCNTSNYNKKALGSKSLGLSMSTIIDPFRWDINTRRWREHPRSKPCRPRNCRPDSARLAKSGYRNCERGTYLVEQHVAMQAEILAAVRSKRVDVNRPRAEREVSATWDIRSIKRLESSTIMATITG